MLGTRSRSNGQLVGYSGGLPHKKWLLDMETKNAQVLRAVKNKRRQQAETTEAKEEEIKGDKEEGEEKETKEPTKRAKKDTTTETSA